MRKKAANKYFKSVLELREERKQCGDTCTVFIIRSLRLFDFIDKGMELCYNYLVKAKELCNK